MNKKTVTLKEQPKSEIEFLCGDESPWVMRIRRIGKKVKVEFNQKEYPGLFENDFAEKAAKIISQIGYLNNWMDWKDSSLTNNKEDNINEWDRDVRRDNRHFDVSNKHANWSYGVVGCSYNIFA